LAQGFLFFQGELVEAATDGAELFVGVLADFATAVCREANI
jgi:hypothetical protein